MKIDEGLGLDREDAFQTDDEENRAERLWCREDDTESDFTLPSRINVLSGIGLLTTPYAVKGGWLSLTTTHNIRLLSGSWSLNDSCNFDYKYKFVQFSFDQVGFHRTGTVLDLGNLPISVGAAISGFLIFGDSVESQFTLNMPIKFAASKIAVLTVTPIASSLEELVPSTWFRSYGVSVLIRTALVISTLVVAITVPFFAFLMALAGSLLSMLIAIIFPCACYLSILRGRLTKLQMVVCICIVILGLVIACVDTYSALPKIAGKLN
ncbi:hypothetical protein REPUB_Repub06bG0198500 [Reevesia pubescens]